jgi:hypothetical protein
MAKGQKIKEWNPVDVVGNLSAIPWQISNGD